MTPEWSTPEGLLATANEGSFFQFFFAYNLGPQGQLLFLSGELPPGLTLNTQDGSLIGNIPLIYNDRLFAFTLRLQTPFGISDRTFSIQINAQSISWITPSIILDEIDNFKEKQIIDFQLEVSEPNARYDLIAGSLPPNVTLTSSGALIGFVTQQGSYFFTVRATTQATILDNSFHLIVLDGSSNRPPYWASLPGWIGDIKNGVPFTFNLKAFDPDNDQLTFTLHPDDSIPPGFTLTSDGVFSGILTVGIPAVYDFRIIIDDGQQQVTRRFFVRANFSLQNDFLTIIQPPGSTLPASLGKLLQDEDAFQIIQAIGTGSWIRYEITDGALPPGLSLNTVTGTIEGTVSASASPGTYTFTVKAYNDIFLEDSLVFSIDVKANTFFKPNRISTILMGEDRQKFNQYSFNYNTIYKNIFRPQDRNFGLTFTHELILKKYVDATANAVFTALKDLRRTIARPYKFKSFPVVGSESDFICDAVILMFRENDYSSLLNDATFANIIEITENNMWASRNSFAKWDTGVYQTDIQNNLFVSPNHELYTGKKMIFNKQDIPSPFLNDTVYYAIVVDENRFRLAQSFSDSEMNEFISFNINDTNRPGIYLTHRAGIPIVYLNRGEGQKAADYLNTIIDDSIRMYVRHVLIGPSTSKNPEDMQLLWFDEEYNYPGGDL